MVINYLLTGMILQVAVQPTYGATQDFHPARYATHESSWLLYDGIFISWAYYKSL